MKIRILLKSFESRSLESFFQNTIDYLLSNKKKKWQLLAAASLPMRIQKYCILRSPHGDKDSREQYEFRIHSKILDIIVFENGWTMFSDLFNKQVPVGTYIDIYTSQENTKKYI